jgi:DNA repair exonuclease SbcCD ATPase subunit
MSSSSQASVRRSLRPHTGASVKENLRKAREEAKARQAKLEELASPIHSAIERLDKLDGTVGAKASAAERKEKALREACEKKIVAIRAEYEKKIAELHAATENEMQQARTAQAADEHEALTQYAHTIIDFRDGATVSELATVLGMSVRAVKSIIAEAEQTLAGAGSEAQTKTAN